MTSRPILFSGPMVRALLAGTKTQTRRVIKPAPFWTGERVETGFHAGQGWHWKAGKKRELHNWPDSDAFAKAMWPYSPYGQPGDRLWVRETFLHELAGSTDQTGEWVDWWCDKGCVIEFVADGAKERHLQPNIINSTYMKKRPSIHMPRWASRITLEITDVRVQRLQDISEEDANAEGCQTARCEKCNPDWPECEGAKHHYMHLWDSINAKRGYGWDTSPWVWALNFKRVTP